jgi:PAS domain S-box-containing protein
MAESRSDNSTKLPTADAVNNIHEFPIVDALLQSLVDGVALFDKEKKVVLINRTMTAMTGLSNEGFHLSEFNRLFKEDLDLEAELNKTIAKTTRTVREVTIAGVYYDVYVIPVLAENKENIGGAILLRDISQLKEIDRMKTEFVSVASHQLRTPLTAIKLFVEKITTGKAGALSEKQVEYLNDIESLTERMITLVNDLLNVSRLETGRLKIEPVSTDIELFLQGIVDDAKTLAEPHGCSISFEKSEQPIGEIPLDQALLRQVVNNLITNSIRYSKSECEIKMALKTVDDFHEISVADNGIGIPKEVQPRIFEKFFRADNAMKAAAKGSGLGMYVAKMITEAFGGQIRFESDGDQGATFYVRIPAKGMKSKRGEKGIAG